MGHRHRVNYPWVGIAPIPIISCQWRLSDSTLAERGFPHFESDRNRCSPVPMKNFQTRATSLLELRIKRQRFSFALHLLPQVRAHNSAGFLHNRIRNKANGGQTFFSHPNQPHLSKHGKVLGDVGLTGSRCLHQLSTCACLVDVCKPAEHREAHNEGAQLIQLGQLQKRAGEIDRDSLWS